MLAVLTRVTAVHGGAELLRNAPRAVILNLQVMFLCASGAVCPACVCDCENRTSSPQQRLGRGQMARRVRCLGSDPEGCNTYEPT